MIRIVESFFVKSAVEPKDYPASAYTEFAFAGRSNVGKSSLINLLTNKHLLAKISRFWKAMPIMPLPERR